MDQKTTDITNVGQLVSQYEFRFKKRFGQNFLSDPKLLQKIVASAHIGPEDFVLEIGPGLGSLTRVLAKQAKQVVAIEIDEDLVEILSERLIEENIQIVPGDALKLDWQKALSDNRWAGQPVKLVANLPYYLTSPLVMKGLTGEVPFQCLVVMVQKEVALRMLAKPGTKDYGILSLAIQYYTDPSLVMKVSRGAFVPPPDVDSAVVRLECIPPKVSAPPEPLFEVIRASFGQRRKTIRNSMKSLVKSWGISLDQFDQVLRGQGIEAQRRGETLSLQQFSDVTESLLQLRR